jgi:hypothetical protein
LADWLELLALTGDPLGADKLADHLKDTNWTVRSRELFYEPGVDEPTEDDQEGGAGVSPPEEVADQVLSIAESRQAALGQGLYPFKLEGNALSAIEPLLDSHRPYLVLLAITAAHHYDVSCTHVPERVFESLVAEAMRSRGLATCDLGATGRAARDFRETVRLAGHEVRVLPDEAGAPSRRWANDEGVDTVSHMSWGDTRPGHWLYIGQVTVGASNTWPMKIMQPAPAQWRGFMASMIEPVGYLAVPHHVEEEHLHYLTYKHSRLVLDRLRLVRHLPPPDVGSPADAVLVAVRNAGVYDPRY